jgi:hypothetical protein
VEIQYRRVRCFDLISSKLGGTLFIAEHTVNPWTRKSGSVIARLFQSVYMLIGWSMFMGDCHLTRDTLKTIRNASKSDGGWESEEFEYFDEASCVPWVVGRFVKKGE